MTLEKLPSKPQKFAETRLERRGMRVEHAKRTCRKCGAALVYHPHESHPPHWIQWWCECRPWTCDYGLITTVLNVAVAEGKAMG
jgi:hypothetical protein